ncbi:hypothetical protein B296_00057292, partial [Ensete ventricosum]
REDREDERGGYQRYTSSELISPHEVGLKALHVAEVHLIRVDQPNTGGLKSFARDRGAPHPS